LSEKIDIDPVEKNESESENCEETEGEEKDEPERLSFELTDYTAIHVLKGEKKERVVYEKKEKSIGFLFTVREEERVVWEWYGSA
jgi:hypothetical protein